MADVFQPIWAQDGTVEVPSDPQIRSGFSCGPVSPGMFNWLFQTMQAAINALDIGDFASKFRTIATTEGITGGGNLEENRTLRLNIPGLEAKSSVASADLLVIYDPVANAHRKQTRLQFIAGLGGEGGILSAGDNIGDGTGEFFSGIDGDTLEYRTAKNAGGLVITTTGDVVNFALANFGAELTYS